jgi:signal transduction histidine kinase
MMATFTSFQRYLSDVLEAFSRGEYGQTDLTECPFKGEAESKIVRSLEGVQEHLAATKQQMPFPDAADQSPRILIVDDSELMRTMITDALADQGYVIHTAQSGEEALALIDESPPDVVLLDHEMPGLKGIDVLRSIKGRASTCHILVIIITAHVDDLSIETALSTGASEFIPKPFSRSVCRARVRNVVCTNELLQKYKTLREVADAANRSKSEFLANMSHEIRTPMTAILGFSEILEGREVDQEQLEMVRTIRRNGEYLIGIINDILDLSKIEAGKLEIEHIQCSPCQVLSEVVSLMRVRASAKNLPLVIEYDGPIPQSIQSDPVRLRQILINLTGNAVKFTEVGKIRLVARLTDADSNEPKMRFDVIDSGIGMAEEQIGKLFQPFVQADSSTTRKFGGTGLGLTITKRLAEILGGNVYTHSVPGEGSTFSVTVSTGPLDGVKMVDNPTEAEVPTEQVAKSATGDARLDCRVLLAEDGPDNQRMISFILKKAGADVAVAENGQVAFDLALAARDEGNPFDVILMDMQMPVLDGYGATGKLREAGYSGPIIALTAHAMSSDKVKCLNAGCDEYTTKPIDRKRLISLVAQYASGRKSEEVFNVQD